MALGFSLLASFVRVYGGRLSDKVGGEKVAFISFGFILAGAVLLMTTKSFEIDFVGEVMIGAGMGIASGAIFKLVPTYVHKAPGGASGLVGGLGAFGGFIVPPFMGMFIDAYGKAGFARGFIIYIILAVVSMIISFMLMRKNSKTAMAPKKKAA